MEAEYRTLSNECRKQCKALVPFFERDKNFVIEKVSSKKEQKYAKCLAIKKMPLLQLLGNKALYQSLYAYYTGSNVKEQGRITIGSLLVADDHACLMNCGMEVLDTNDNKIIVPVVCKYYKSSKKDIEFELECYRKLRISGLSVPWFSSSYRVLDQPILVLGKLYPIDIEMGDDPYQMGIEVIDQLRYVHKIGVHNDLKPGNIMVNRDDTFPLGKAGGNNGSAYKYVIIDYGGTATQPLEYGFKRYTRTPKFTCQQKGEPNQITTGLHDLIELGYVMNFIEHIISEKSNSDDDSSNSSDDDHKKKQPFDYRTQFKGKLMRYMSIVNRIDPAQFKANTPSAEKLYSKLTEILNN